jgi:hypothetical protein
MLLCNMSNRLSREQFRAIRKVAAAAADICEGGVNSRPARLKYDRLQVHPLPPPLSGSGLKAAEPMNAAPKIRDG